jgi:hypothetical protein
MRSIGEDCPPKLQRRRARANPAPFFTKIPR